MPINTQNLRHYLQDFDFKSVFLEELNWNNAKGVNIRSIEIEGIKYQFKPIAQQGQMVITECFASNKTIPSDAHRRKIDTHVTKSAYEHIIIFVDESRTVSRWQWVKREDGKQGRLREQIYRKGEPSEILTQKLIGIAFELDELDDDGQLSIVAVINRVTRAFDVERVTRKFYDQFQREHKIFLEYIKGVQDIQGRDWYASVMLNRLMFLYFIQSKGFLNNDRNYLQTKLAESQTRGKDRFYRDFLLILFFEGLANEESERTPEVNRLLGKIPYLNGGIFMPHQIEEANQNIQLADIAFENLFKYFDEWDWLLDDRPTASQKEINPDVLGYIFEKYINQKQMGAYYTKEDITDYICKNTILPFLLNKIDLNVAQEIGNIDLYIYDAVSTDDALPTEIEREYVARRNRYDEIISDFSDGKITTVNDLITYNLDIRGFAQDWLNRLDAPIMLRRFYKALTELTVLDPTCGSGAFLFAAMNILEPLYEGCLKKMEQFLSDPNTAFQFNDFKTELNHVDQHPNRRYFIFKSIIINNLYGVDIMDEAIEICKLRLFLKLVAQVDDVRRIEPLPDIDFNIRAGNTLVGFATKDEIAGRMFASHLIPKVETADQALASFREMQTTLNVKASLFKEAKKGINAQLGAIRDELDNALMVDYGHDHLSTFTKNYKPFHWYVEFNRVMTNGGFDVIVGNPPYVEYSKVKKDYTVLGYETITCGNLYAFTCEKAISIGSKRGRIGLIVPLSLVSTERMKPLQSLFTRKVCTAWFSNFDVYPTKLFEGAKQRLTIFMIASTADKQALYSTTYNRWKAEAREALFGCLTYHQTHYDPLLSVIPKTGSKLSESILHKLALKKPAHYINNGKTPSFYVHRIPYNYVKALNFIPYFWNAVDGVKKSEDYKPYFLANVSHTLPLLAMLNSNLFFWWWYTLFEGYHCGQHEIHAFPTGIELMADEIKSALSQIAVRLMDDFQNNALRKKAQYKTTGAVEYDEFYPRLSKPLIDEIDRVLAQHYRFTDEELDYLINYDIKFRLVRGDEPVEEGGD